MFVITAMRPIPSISLHTVWEKQFSRTFATKSLATAYARKWASQNKRSYNVVTVEQARIEWAQMIEDSQFEVMEYHYQVSLNEQNNHRHADCGGCIDCMDTLTY